jgi:hypothetical protein
MLTFTIIHPQKRELGVPSKHISTKKWPEIYETLRTVQKVNRQGWGAYIGIAYRKGGLDRWHRGGKADLIALPALFADIEQPPENLPEQLNDLPEPSWIIRSSNAGSHIYWLLDYPSHELHRADYILHGIAEYLHSDTSMTIDNILRLPGTYNTKPDRNSLCQIVEGHPQNRYVLANFSKWMLIPEQSRHKQEEHDENSIFSEQAYNKRHTSNEILNPKLIAAINQKLLHEFQGHYNKKGWICSFAPCSHQNDKFPGDHFNWNPITGIGYCYGRHGRLYTHEVADLLGIRIKDYGKLFTSNIPNRKAN